MEGDKGVKEWVECQRDGKREEDSGGEGVENARKYRK